MTDSDRKESRFTRNLNFEDYTPPDLCRIFERRCGQDDYNLTPAARARAFLLFSAAYGRRDENFGNARLVRNVFQEATILHAERLVKIPGERGRDLLPTLDGPDIPLAVKGGIDFNALDLTGARWEAECPACHKTRTVGLGGLGESCACECGQRYVSPWWNLVPGSLEGFPSDLVFTSLPADRLGLPEPAPEVRKVDEPPVAAKDVVVESLPRLEVWLDRAKGVKMEFVRISPGKFRMGSKGGDANEKPVHEVEITRDFWMGVTEVTQEQWELVMGGNPSHFKGADLPVEQVSWDVCRDFLRKLNEKYGDQAAGNKFTLPTEAEWEYACRAGSGGKWCFGDDKSKLGEYAWYCENSGGKTHEVRQKKPNGWGLYDMHGNVWEWCGDWYGPYGAGAIRDPQGASSGGVRVLRGPIRQPPWAACAGVSTGVLFLHEHIDQG